MVKSIWTSNFRDSDSEEEEPIKLQPIQSFRPKTFEEILILEDEQERDQILAYKRDAVDISEVVEEVNAEFVENPFAIAARLARLKKTRDFEAEEDDDDCGTRNGNGSGFSESNLMKRARLQKSIATRLPPTVKVDSTVKPIKVIPKNPLQAGFERQALIKPPPLPIIKRATTRKPKVKTIPPSTTPSQILDKIPISKPKIMASTKQISLPANLATIERDVVVLDERAAKPILTTRKFLPLQLSSVAAIRSNASIPSTSSTSAHTNSILKPASQIKTPRIDLSRVASSPISNYRLAIRSNSTVAGSSQALRAQNPFNPSNNLTPRFTISQHPLSLSSYGKQISPRVLAQSSSPLGNQSRSSSPIRKKVKLPTFRSTSRASQNAAGISSPPSSILRPISPIKKVQLGPESEEINWSTLNCAQLIPKSSFYGSHQSVGGDRLASLNSTTATATRAQGMNSNSKNLNQKKFVSPFRQPIAKSNPKVMPSEEYRYMEGDGKESLQPTSVTALQNGRKLSLFTPQESVAQFKARKAREEEDEVQGAEEIKRIFGTSVSKRRL